MKAYEPGGRIRMKLLLRRTLVHWSVGGLETCIPCKDLALQSGKHFNRSKCDRLKKLKKATY